MKSLLSRNAENCHKLTNRVHTNRWFNLNVTTLCILLLAGCSAPPDLIAFGAARTSETDFTGSWHRNESINPTNLPAVPLEADQQQAAQKRRPSSRPKGPGLAIFYDGLYLSAKNIRMTQDETVLFVKFDLARVEEYRFGEKRLANIGPLSILRVSGWEGDQYVVRSVTDDGTNVEDRYYLSNNGLRLHRVVSVEGRDQSKNTVRQVFDRVP